MDQKERMLRGLPYKAWLDGLEEERQACQVKLWEYNNLPPERWGERDALLRQILGGVGERVALLPPFRCDYGTNIFLGNDVQVNYNLTVLDVGRVSIGDRGLIAPNVSIYTAGHPVHPLSRRSGYEYGIEVSIGDDVWIGGSVTILPGVHIGSGSVIGGGSVVTKDIPENVIAVGSPCRVLRPITDEDRHYYYKDRRFDVEDY